MATAHNTSRHKLYKAANTTPSSKQQTTISQLFHSSQESQPKSPIEYSPNGKRRRRGSTLLSQSSTDVAPVTDMYNFSITSSNGEEAIDLTGSPPNVPISPHRKARRLSLTARVDNSSPMKGLKKLPVKNLRAGPKTDPSEYCNKATGQLTEALAAIFENRRPQLSNEELYRASENLCKLGRAPETTKILLEKCKQHILVDFKQPLAERAAEDSVEVLRVVLEAWSTWNKQLVQLIHSDPAIRPPLTNTLRSSPFAPYSSILTVPTFSSNDYPRFMNLL